MIEKVNPCHPDKVADRIAGAIVDLAYSKVENPKIAVEVLLGHGVANIIIERHLGQWQTDHLPKQCKDRRFENTLPRRHHQPFGRLERWHGRGRWCNQPQTGFGHGTISLRRWRARQGPIKGRCLGEHLRLLESPADKTKRRTILCYRLHRDRRKTIRRDC